jgi:hypothetical protein
MIRRSRFYPRQGQRIFLLAPVSRPAVGPIQPPIQWVLGVLSPGVKRGWGMTLTTGAVQSPSDPERAVRIRTRLYTRENITIYHAISPFGCRVFSFSWKRIYTERQAGLRTPATAIIFNSCWLQNLFLDFEVCQN